MVTSNKIKAMARAVGFDKVGIAEVVQMREEVDHLRAWIDKGYHATMRWMSRTLEKRESPGNVLPGARSIVSVALNYYTPYEHSNGKGKGKISRYAWGDDYHDIVGEKLAMLWESMQATYPEIAGKYYVDTGPVMEKVWAQRAGLGWIGKHTNLITPDIGSWVFLGEIITSLEIEPDEPATDHCGTCTLCIEACPTGAITEPYVVDSGLCLSYLTIEHREEITGKIRDQFDGWIYGCDVCQDVCPWNHKFSVVTPDDRFAPRPGNEAPDLDSWSRMSAGEFSSKFKGSPMKRAKLDGLQRNITIALQDSMADSTSRVR